MAQAKTRGQGGERWKSPTNLTISSEVWKSPLESPSRNSMPSCMIVGANNPRAISVEGDLWNCEHDDYTKDEFESDDEMEKEDPQAIYDVEQGVSAKELATLWNIDRPKEASALPRVKCSQSNWLKLQECKALKEVSDDMYSQRPKIQRISARGTQVDIDLCLKSTTTQTKQVSKANVASLVPEDLTMNAETPHKNSFYNSSSKLFRRSLDPGQHSIIKETQLKYFIIQAAHIIESVLKPQSQPESSTLSELVRSSPLSSAREVDSSVSGGVLDAFYEGFLTGRHLEFISFKDTSASMILCGYSPSTDLRIPNARQGCICIYDVLTSLQPKKVLVLEGSPRCACWVVPMRRRGHEIVVAGTDAGSLALWDLSDQRLGNLSQQLALDSMRPTYSSSHCVNDNHPSPVRSILYSNLTASTSPDGALQEAINLGGIGEIMTILTLDSFAMVHIWIIKEVLSPTWDTDPGLVPGEAVCLVKTGEMQALPSWPRTLEIAMPEVCLLAAIPGSTHEILVAINNGTLMRAALIGSPGTPQRYSCQSLGMLPPSLVVSVCFSPFVEECFLVAYADATLALFTLEKEVPWRLWTLKTSASQVISAQWSPTYSSVFLVMDSSSVMHVWDILHNSEGPILSEELCSSDGSNGPVRALEFQVSKRRSGGGMEHTFAVGNDDNHVYVHLLNLTVQHPASGSGDGLRKCLASSSVFRPLQAECW